VAPEPERKLLDRQPRVDVQQADAQERDADPLKAALGRLGAAVARRGF
jgi:hypothetical protein